MATVKLPHASFLFAPPDYFYLIINARLHSQGSVLRNALHPHSVLVLSVSTATLDAFTVMCPEVTGSEAQHRELGLLGGAGFILLHTEGPMGKAFSWVTHLVTEEVFRRKSNVCQQPAEYWTRIIMKYQK